MSLPPFHTMGIYTQVIYPLYCLNCIGVFPPTVVSKASFPIMATPANILEHTARTKSNAIITVPAFIQIWAQSKESIDLLKTLEFVVSNLGNFFIFVFHTWLRYFSGILRRKRRTKTW